MPIRKKRQPTQKTVSDQETRKFMPRETGGEGPMPGHAQSISEIDSLAAYIRQSFCNAADGGLQHRHARDEAPSPREGSTRASADR